MHRKSGRYPSWGVFREQSGKLVVKRASCALLFLLLLSNGKIVTRPFAGKGVPVGLPKSENAGFRRFECCTTLPTDHDVGGAVRSVPLCPCPLAMPTFAPPSRAFHALLIAAESCASPRLRVGRGRAIHLILSSQFGYGIPPCEYEVATFVEMEPQPSFMDFPAYPCNNQEAESHRGDKAKGDSIVA